MPLFIRSVCRGIGEERQGKDQPLLCGFVCANLYRDAILKRKLQNSSGAVTENIVKFACRPHCQALSRASTEGKRGAAETQKQSPSGRYSLAQTAFCQSPSCSPPQYIREGRSNKKWHSGPPPPPSPPPKTSYCSPPPSHTHQLRLTSAATSDDQCSQL